RLTGAPRAPPPPRCAIRPRAPPARLRPRASAARDCECPQPPQVEGSAHEIPFPAHLRHAAEGEATKAHRPLDLRVPAKDVPYARGPNSAAGRRGRRRSAYEAPRAAADRGTRLGGAESKRRRRPRLPAPPSRVTLLGRPTDDAGVDQRGDALGGVANLGERRGAVGAEQGRRAAQHRRRRLEVDEGAAHAERTE